MRVFVRLYRLFFFCAAVARAQYADTTQGTQENSAIYGGLSEADQRALDQKIGKNIERFKEGRAAKSGTRHWDILTHHDHDFDGLGDHKDSQNTLEGGMEKAGKIEAAKGKTREEKIQNATANAGRCKEGLIGASKDNPCKNISSVIVDKGAAHGDEKDEHRVYDLSKEAVAEASNAAKAYANRVFAEAANYEVDAEAKKLGVADMGVGTDSKGRYGKLIKGTDGQVRAVAPNIDIMQSESAFLNEQAVNVIDKEAKTLRALRLAGVNTASGDKDPELVNLISHSKTEGIDDEVARRIAERSELGGAKVCAGKVEGDLKKACDNVASELCQKNKDDPECLKNTLSGLTAKEISSSKVAAESRDGTFSKIAYDEARKSIKGDAKAQARITNNVSLVKECMKPGVWCVGGVKAGSVDSKKVEGGVKNGEDIAFKKFLGDPGEVYTDTREIIFNQASQALRGGAANMMGQMRNADFNEKTDGKTDIKYFREWEALQKRALQRAKELGIDPSRATVAEILKQDRQRGDGGTLRRPGSDAAPSSTRDAGVGGGVSPPPRGNLMNQRFAVPGSSY